jgi:hypothetical protein
LHQVDNPCSPSFGQQLTLTLTKANPDLRPGSDASWLFLLSQIADPLAFNMRTTKPSQTHEHAQETVNETATNADKIMRPAVRAEVRVCTVNLGSRNVAVFR